MREATSRDRGGREGAQEGMEQGGGGGGGGEEEEAGRR